jgi:predicted RNase H-like nuclease (RuvC/YqgF family)
VEKIQRARKMTTKEQDPNQWQREEFEKKDQQIKKLCADVGNLEFQISDYRQIVKELSDKLSNYETLHGTVFRSSVEKK